MSCKIQFMSHLNIEIKARCADHDRLRAILRERCADFRGVDRQMDTYFHCPNGRLKVRQGNIENALIHYRRPNQAGPKRSDVALYRADHDLGGLKEVLAGALGTTVVVEKRREIYFLDHVKIHLDEVPGLGMFLEIEAIDEDGSRGEDVLCRQCEALLADLGVEPADLLTHSYSDMLADTKHSRGRESSR